MYPEQDVEAFALEYGKWRLAVAVLENKHQRVMLELERLELELVRTRRSEKYAFDQLREAERANKTDTE